jgi:hypothetical protein
MAMMSSLDVSKEPPKMKKPFNSFEIAQAQFDRVAEILELRVFHSGPHG